LQQKKQGGKVEIIMIITIIILSVVISSVITKILIQKNTVSKQDFERMTLEKITIENKFDEDRSNQDQFISEQKLTIAELRHDLQLMRDRAMGLEYEKTSNVELKSQLAVVLKELQSAREKLTALETEKTILHEQREFHIKQVQEMQENLRLQFENIGNKIFTEHSKTFKQESQSRLTELLSPLKGDIDGFKKKLEESFGTQAKEQHSLKSEIERIVKVNEQMTSQTTHLTKALKGDFRTQGHWGEIILERILEESGLRAGEDYILQGSEMGMKHPDTGQTLKPDVIIKLPENKHIIIDSKVSLTDYERYSSQEDENTRAGHLKQFLFSVKKHVNDLEQRRYQDVDKLKTPDFVLMFMPIEGAFSLAIQQDRELHSFAWGKKVVIVSPSTLFATLRTISSIWRLELQHKHALEIARQGGLLYDKIASFVIDMQKLGNQLNISQAVYSAAMSKLHEGKGNILSRTQQLQTLGAKASKNLLKAIPQAFNEQEGGVIPSQSNDSQELDTN
jgi:DNA recombination protein RmuC